jgi:hypothetical protein
MFSSKRTTPSSLSRRANLYSIFNANNWLIIAITQADIIAAFSAFYTFTVHTVYVYNIVIVTPMGGGGKVEAFQILRLRRTGTHKVYKNKNKNIYSVLFCYRVGVWKIGGRGNTCSRAGSPVSVSLGRSAVSFSLLSLTSVFLF